MNSNCELNVLVVGAGMYVCGKGTDGYGTILPSLYRGKREGLVRNIGIAATRSKSAEIVASKMKELNGLFGFDMEASLYPEGEKDDSTAYLGAMCNGEMPDCVIVSVPDHLHCKVASHFLRKGAHCLVVKPLAPTLPEARELVDLAKEQNVYGAVEFHKRYDRSNLKLRDTIRQGLLGDPLYFVVEYSQRKNIPVEVFKEWVDHTNIFQYLGIHYIDIIYFATGAMPRRVMAVGQKGHLADQGIDNYDAIQCIVEWEDAKGHCFTSTLFTNWIDPEGTSAMSDQKIKVIGTKGRYEADQKRRGITIVTDERGIEEPNPDFSSFYGSEGIDYQGYGSESILQFLKDVRDIRNGMLTPSDLEGRRPTFMDSIVPTAILEAAHQSLAAGGQWVHIETPILNRGETHER